MSVDLESRRAELVSMRDRVLRAAQDIVEDDDADTELSSAAGDQHLADHAGEMFDRELDDSLEDNAGQLVREIDAALGRIDAGTYGTCARCANQIPEERLSAVPYSVLCVGCKRIEEHE